MRSRILITLIFSFTVTHVFCQKINYKDVRLSVFHLPSGEPDSTILLDTIHSLESMDTNDITRHIAIYYTDLGWAYWLLCNINNTSSNIDLCLTAYRSALYHEPKNSEALWHCSLGYYHEGQCDQAKLYMTLFKKHTPEKYWKTECIDLVETKCQ